MITRNISIAPLPKQNKWITTNPLRWYISPDKIGEYIEVPEGFIFDGVTAPYILGGLLQKIEPKTINPACLHDRLYTIGHDRKQSDDIFYEALIACGVQKWKSCIFWLGCRLFGRYHWNNTRKG